ncbi:MAG: hypothetical protein RJA76_534 [Bacteroidota bacterium]|jgi:hypothetical protein
MKKLFLSFLILFTGLQILAQSTDKTYIMLIESRVKDIDLYKKNNPIVRNWWMKESGGILSNRVAHTSESGRTYNMIFVKGEKNLGEYIAKREALNERVGKELKEISQASRENQSQATLRSTWAAVEKNTLLVPDFKVENYDFRKVVIFTVPFDKTTEYEKLIEESNALDKSLGFSYNYIVYRATDGYPTNTYMMLLPDKSRIDYYTHQSERNAVRKNNAKSDELNKKAQALRTVVRIDYLSRVPIQ